eukprot:2381333-Prymnesium_polylepis.1
MERCGVTSDVLAPTKGYHFESGAYVEYAGKLSVEEREALLPRLQEALDGLIAEGLPVEVETKDGSRHVTIGGVGCGCGGTHVRRVDQIGRVELKGIKKKGKAMRVSYAVVDAACPGARRSALHRAASPTAARHRRAIQTKER